MSAKGATEAGLQDAPGQVRVIEDIVFANAGGVELLADIYLPAETENRPPVAVYLHGGGWRAGDRKLDRDWQLRPLAGHGLAVVSVEYRLTDQGQFPDQIHDAKAAVRWVRAHADEYGWDPERVGAIGSSSGGHLTGLLALTAGNPELEGTVGDELEQDSSVGAAVLLFPVVDPAQWDYESFHRGPQPPPETFAGRYPFWPPPPRAALLLGVEDAEQASELNAKASVLTYVNAENPPPFRLLHGDVDTAVFLTHSQQLHAALQGAGADSSLLIVAGADHVGPEYSRPEIIGGIASFFHAALVPSIHSRP
jgi:acetyl esterase/lipase